MRCIVVQNNYISYQIDIMIKYLVPPAETSGLGVTYYAEEKNENIFVLFHFNSLEFFNHVSALHSILVCTK